MIIINEPAPVECPHCNFKVISFERESDGTDLMTYCQHVAFYFDDSFEIEFPESLDDQLIEQIMLCAGIEQSSVRCFESSETMLDAISRLEEGGYICVKSQPASGFGMVGWLVFLPKHGGFTILPSP